MSPNRIRRRRRLAEPRGTILVTCLLLMVFAAFLTGLVLLLGHTEASITSTSRGNMLATHAAEYGIELAINNLNTSQVPAAFTPQTLTPGVRATPGLRDGSSSSAANTGVSACPPGYSSSLGCSAYTFTATGWARGWLSLTTTASVQVEKSESIYRGCNGTEYSC